MGENSYTEALGNRAFYPSGSTDPVRGNVPFTPVTIVNPGGKPNVPILGVVILVGIALWFEFMRRKHGRRK